MGREAKLLLALLGLLAGVFVGVLSMKLLVPRPPAGAGPDIHADFTSAPPVELVEPPTPTLPAGGFAAAPPLVPAVPAVDDAPPRLPSAFVRPEPAAMPMVETGVVATSLETPQPDPPRSRYAPRDPPPADDLLPPAAPPVFVPPSAPPVTSPPADMARTSGPPPQGVYVVQSGDSWWSIADRAYGDGRLYRALFAWNRVVDPRVTLAPETPLEIPPIDRLAAAWPRLMPRDAGPR